MGPGAQSKVTTKFENCTFITGSELDAQEKKPLVQEEIRLDVATPEEVVRVMAAYRRAEVAGLPMAPEQPIVVRPEPDRPQPRRDRMTGRGMSTVVGRVRAEPLFGDCGVKFVTLAHNTIRGAAGGSLLNAEVIFKVFMIGN